MSGSDYERELLNILEDEYGWLAVRSAGSMGKGDIIAIHPKSDNSPIVIEAKKTSKDRHYCSQDPEQFEMMSGHAERGINSVYAVRHTTGSLDNRWQIHWLDGNEKSPSVLKREDGLNLDTVFNVE